MMQIYLENIRCTADFFNFGKEESLRQVFFKKSFEIREKLFYKASRHDCFLNIYATHLYAVYSF